MKRFAWVFTTIQLLGMGQVNSVIANEFENTSNSESPSMTVEIEDDTFENTSNRLEAIQQDFNERSKPFTLDEAIAFAVANNKTIQAAYRSVQSKQWSAISDKRLWWPTASGAGPYGDVNIVPTWPTLGQRFNSTETRSYTINEDGKPYLKSTESKNFTSLDQFVPAIAVRWTFFDMPRGQAIKSSTEAARAEELLFNMTVRDIVLKVQEGYFALYREISKLESLKLNYKESVKFLGHTEAKYKGEPSLVNKNAVQQAKAALYGQLEHLIEVHVNLIKAATNMSEQLGLPMGTLLRPSDDFRLRPIGSWSMNLTQTVEHALNHREEILAAQKIANSQSHLATSLSYSYIPKFSLYGYADYTDQSGIYGATKTTKEYQSSSWGPSGNFGLIMSWNFDGTVSDAKARSLRYAAKQSLAKARAAEEMAAVQAGTAFIEYTTAKMGLDTAKAALVNARQARDSSRELYRQNKIDATSFSTATYAVVRESNAYSKAIFNYNHSLSKLFRYTAIWPSGVSETLDEAVNVLKEG